MEIAFERGIARFSAFPWTSEIVEFGKRGRSSAYWRDRIAAKFLGLRAAGLEPSLMRELDAIRQAIAGHPVDPARMPFATARDGARTAEIVQSIAHQAIDSQNGVRIDRSEPAYESRCA
jgi:hypothetical protein